MGLRCLGRKCDRSSLDEIFIESDTAKLTGECKMGTPGEVLRGFYGSNCVEFNGTGVATLLGDTTKTTIRADLTDSQ